MSNRKPKPSKAIVQRRVEEVLRIILDGAEALWDVREYVREKEQEAGSAWELPAGAKPLSDSQLFRYIARANRLIAESCRASRKKLLRRHLAQRRNLYAKAVSQGDVRAALACLDSEAKLTGLFDAELNRLVEQLAREIEQLKASYGHSSTPTALETNGGRPAHLAEPGDATADGSAATGSGADDAPGRPDPGPLASEPAPGEDLDPGSFVV
jgi:hypothetical protein